MTKLYYQFPNTWFGDCMPFGKGDQFIFAGSVFEPEQAVPEEVIAPSSVPP